MLHNKGSHLNDVDFLSSLSRLLFIHSVRLLSGADIEIFTKDRESSVEALMVFWFCLMHLRVQAKAEGMSLF